MSDLNPSTAALQNPEAAEANRQQLFAALRKAQDDAKFWRESAWRVGEIFPGPMPEGYYQMAPEEWEKWVTNTIDTLLARVKELEGFLSAYEDW